MPWGLAATAAIGAAGSIASGITGSDAAKKAAAAQVAAAGQASQTELQQFDQTKASLKPWVDAGGNALGSLQQLLGIGGAGGPAGANPILQMLGLGGPGGTGAGNINPATFQGSPGYNYALQQGTNAVTNSAAANGGMGGNALRALQSTGQGLANQNFNQYVGTANNAWQNMLSNVSGVANTGLGAAEQTGTFGANTASQIGGNQIYAGDATAAGDIGSARALQGMIQGLVSAASTAAGGGGGSALGVGGSGSAGGVSSGSGLAALLSTLFSGGSGGGVGTQPSTINPFGNTSSDASNPQTYG